MSTMQAAVFLAKGKIAIREVPKPEPGPGEAVVKMSVTTICGTDVHILKPNIRSVKVWSSAMSQSASSTQWDKESRVTRGVTASSSARSRLVASATRACPVT